MEGGRESWVTSMYHNQIYESVGESVSHLVDQPISRSLRES